MNRQVYEYVKSAVERFSPKGPVLEVGSYNVNGSVRDLFPAEGYVGIDMRAGPGVDRVMNANWLGFSDREFQTVVCVEMLEHDSAFWLSFQEFYRVLEPRGLLILTTRNIGYPRHDYPSDYWRFTGDGLRAVMEWAGFEVLDIQEDESPGTYGVGRKN